MNQEDLMSMTTDTLLAMREQWRKQAKAISALAEQAESEILRRLEADNATVFAAEDGRLWQVKPGLKSYSYRMEVLNQLGPLLRPGEYEGIVHERTEYDVDKAKLNGLLKRGGVIAEIIATAVIATEGRPRLEVKKTD